MYDEYMTIPKASDKPSNGHLRSFWMPGQMDKLVEDTRQNIGMNRSAFYKYAITRLLQEMSVLSTKAHEKALEVAA